MNEELELSREREVEVVKTAYFLEANIETLEKEKAELINNKPQMPQKPVEPQIKQEIITPVEYPKPPKSIKVTLGSCLSEVNILIWVGSICFFFPLAIYLFLKCYRNYYEKRGNLNNDENNEEYIAYQKVCRDIDERNKKQQATVDEEMHKIYLREYEDFKQACIDYDENVKIYREKYIPEWEEEITVLQTALNDAKVSLQNLYDRNIIPNQYRNIPALLYLATFLNTSNYDLKFAIERWDTYVMQRAQKEQNSALEAQLQIMGEILQNQQYTNWLNEQMLEMTENGNETLKSISNWQKADFGLREYRRFKAKRNAKNNSK